jgi:DNA-binding winged helix-turn-helix (wHTH) protein
MLSRAHSPRFAFDRFQLDLRSGELRKEGRKVRLQEQPFQFLALLVENAGEVVTREQICRTLWPTDTFVDFDHGVAVALSKIREALGDSADNPRFIETLPKRGYRFIAKVQINEPVLAHASGAGLDAISRSLAAPSESAGASKCNSSELEPHLEIVSGGEKGSSSPSTVARERKQGSLATVLVTPLVLAVAGYGVLAFV